MDFRYSCRKGIYNQDDPFYVLTVVGRLEATFDPFYFEKSWNVVIASHELDWASDKDRELKILSACRGAENYIRGFIQAHVEVAAWK